MDTGARRIITVAVTIVTFSNTNIVLCYQAIQCVLYLASTNTTPVQQELIKSMDTVPQWQPWHRNTTQMDQGRLEPPFENTNGGLLMKPILPSLTFCFETLAIFQAIE